MHPIATFSLAAWLFAFAVVSLAGGTAEAQLPPPAHELRLDQPDDHEVRILDRDGFQIHRCRGKCRLRLPVGDYELRSARVRGHLPISYRVEGPGTLRLRLSSRRGVRTLGRWLPAIFGPAFVISSLRALFAYTAADRRRAGAFAVGFFVVGFSLTFGLTRVRDRITTLEAHSPFD